MERVKFDTAPNQKMNPKKMLMKIIVSWSLLVLSWKSERVRCCKMYPTDKRDERREERRKEGR